MNTKNKHKAAIFNSPSDVLVCFLLVSITLAVYWQVINNEFIDFDDDLYVTENIRVKGGLTMESIVWAFTTTHAANWHPVTWLSHMLDIQLFGMNPGLHHLINVFFHIANTLLLFFIFRRMTGDVWRSSLIAALFSIHPLHTETVAWIAERKDVLSTFFLMLAIWNFIGYVDRPKAIRYLTVLLFFSLGLMAKPMIVTLPFVLLLLDYWPLQRIQFINDERHSYAQQWPTILYLIREKLPFFFLAVGSGIVTVITQQSGGALRSLEAYPFHIRMANALVSYVTYILKMIWPFHLSVYYPYRSIIPVWQVFAASLLIIFISVLVIRANTTRPWFAVGWFWYIGTLGPVIGLVQVGSQAMADRYTYVPFIGLFIMIAWGVPERFMHLRFQRVMLSAITAIVLSCLMVAAAVQVQYWNNTIRLLEHAVNVVPDNYSPRNNLGCALEKLGRTHEAIAHYSKALKLNPNYKEAHNNLGIALAKQGNAEEAKRHYFEALRIDPGFQKAHNNLGIILAAQGKTGEAIQHYAEALRLDPEYEVAHYNLGNALFARGDLKGAIKHFSEALRIKPDYVDSHINLGVALAAQGRIDEAIGHYAAALDLNPNNKEVHCNLGIVLFNQGMVDKAIDHYFKALQIDPEFAEAHNNLGVALGDVGWIAEAITHFQSALRINPGFVDARENLKKVTATRSKIDNDIANIRKKLESEGNDAILNYEIGNIYRATRDLNRAIDHYQRALLREPGLAEALTGLGIAHAMRGNYERALSVLNKAIASRPNHVEAYYYISGIYARQGQVEQSIEWLKQALQRGYSDWDRIKTDGNLTNIRHTSFFKAIIQNH